MTQLANEKYKLKLFKNSSDNILFWVSISVIFGVIENLLPRFFFIKIGFSYVPILLVYRRLKNKEIVVIFFFKFLITNIMSGVLFSHIALLSFSSNFIACCLFLILKSEVFSLFGVSIFISFCSNLSQLLVYGVIILKQKIVDPFIIPIFVLSVITGFISAFLTKLIEKRIIIC